MKRHIMTQHDQNNTMYELKGTDNMTNTNSPSNINNEGELIVKERARKKLKEHPRDFLPIYLHHFVQYGHGDFFYCLSFAPRLIAQLMFEGFLPISNARYCLPKLHKERCVIFPLNKQQQPNSPSRSSSIHVPKSTKKKSKRFTFTINKDFDAVVRGCHAQHGISWLYPQIVHAFKMINEQTIKNSVDNTNNSTNYERNQHHRAGMGVRLIQEDGNGDAGDDMKGSGDRNNSDQNGSTSIYPVRLYSIEVWNAETKQLVGGELGYSIGSIFTSLTGFSSEDSAGSVQLAVLGHLLSKYKFDMWDLGMELDYKVRMGAHNMERADFVEKVKELRIKTKDELLIYDEERNCKDILSEK